MKFITSVFITCLLLAAAAPAFAGDGFHITYRTDTAASDGGEYNVLLLNVYNASGEDVKGLVATVQGPDNVTHDNRPVLVGDIADGQQAEVVIEVNAPAEVPEQASEAETATWLVEYTGKDNVRDKAYVTGHMVQ